eukprot:CAMPEP_0203887998 /NCGR_PEP_ID=MMETSP0359-20131031/31638_1 /ASSEMBLY_ACC=CAM_ASM_000338 /TAXON_ID=268821 /ORGANISM="Scrippsiella Hangoei, Strain SHTV-5" /LENGTH=101 /DNA_ID=CAMNT_0050809111 /DNA_START=268 /DNA_END=573 /DNA_ORIENTATION=-
MTVSPPGTGAKKVCDISTLTPGRFGSLVKSAIVPKTSTNVEVAPPCNVPYVFWSCSEMVTLHTTSPSDMEVHSMWSLSTESKRLLLWNGPSNVSRPPWAAL